jgi:hypothetical protein
MTSSSAQLPEVGIPQTWDELTDAGTQLIQTAATMLPAKVNNLKTKKYRCVAVCDEHNRAQVTSKPTVVLQTLQEECRQAFFEDADIKQHMETWESLLRCLSTEINDCPVEVEKKEMGIVRDRMIQQYELIKTGTDRALAIIAYIVLGDAITGHYLGKKMLLAEWSALEQGCQRLEGTITAYRNSPQPREPKKQASVKKEMFKLLGQLLKDAQLLYGKISDIRGNIAPSPSQPSTRRGGGVVGGPMRLLPPPSLTKVSYAPSPLSKKDLRKARRKSSTG